MRHCWKLTWKQRPRWCKRPHAWQTQQGTRTFLMMTLSRPLHHLHGKQVIILFKILVSFVLQTSFFQCHCFEVISPPLTLGAFSSSHFLQAVDSPLPTCWMSNWPSWLCPKKRVNGCHLIFSFSTLFLLLLLLRLVLMVVVRHFVGDRGVKFLLGGSPQSGGGGPRAHHLIDQGGEQCKCHQRATTNHKLPATHSWSSVWPSPTNAHHRLLFVCITRKPLLVLSFQFDRMDLVQDSGTEEGSRLKSTKTIPSFRMFSISWLGEQIHSQVKSCLKGTLFPGDILAWPLFQSSAGVRHRWQHWPAGR